MTVINSKTLARLAAVQFMYQYNDDLTKTDIHSLQEQLNSYYKSDEISSDYNIDDNSKLKIRLHANFFSKLILLITENITEIDEIIHSCTRDDNTNTVSDQCLMAILRTSVAEIKYCVETPKIVCINEYTNIAAEMLDLPKIGFVNSMLQNISMNISANTPIDNTMPVMNDEGHIAD